MEMGLTPIKQVKWEPLIPILVSESNSPIQTCPNILHNPELGLGWARLRWSYCYCTHPYEFMHVNVSEKDRVKVHYIMSISSLIHGDKFKILKSISTAYY